MRNRHARPSRRRPHGDRLVSTVDEKAQGSPGSPGSTQRFAPRPVHRDAVQHRGLHRVCRRSSARCTVRRRSYTWVVTATLLATTATTPIWASWPTCSARKPCTGSGRRLRPRFGGGGAESDRRAAHPRRGRCRCRGRPCAGAGPDRDRGVDPAEGTRPVTNGYLSSVTAPRPSAAAARRPARRYLVAGVAWCFLIGIPLAAVAVCCSRKRCAYQLSAATT